MNIYQHQKIKEVIKFEIEDGVDSYHDLPEYAKNKLTIICLDLMGSDAYEAILSPKTLHKLIKYMQTGEGGYSLELAESMSDCAESHFEEGLQEVFNDIWAEMRVDKLTEHGLRPYRDNINGEVRWV